MTSHSFKLALALGALVAASQPAMAGSALGDSYGLASSTEYAFDPLTPLNALSSPSTAASGLTPRVDVPNAESDDGQTAYGIYWVDGDSFDLLVRASPNAFSAETIEMASVGLSNLDFKDGATSVPILSVTFNLADSDLEGYLQSPGNPTGATMPGIQVSFSGAVANQTILITLRDYSAQLVGDQALLRFDVQTAAVPEPGTYGLMALGLAGLAGMARRRRKA